MPLKESLMMKILKIDKGESDVGDYFGMLVPRYVENRSPKSHICLQHKTPPPSVTNINYSQYKASSMIVERILKVKKPSELYITMGS